MSPEEFNKLKEQHKAHLRELKKLKGMARDAGRKGRLAQALENIAGAMSPDATYDESMDALAQQTAVAEARFEIAQENAASVSSADDALARAAAAEVHEAALARERARQLVAQMKGQMGGPAAPSPAEKPEAGDASEKTLGRARPSAGEPAGSSAPLPDKTLGRRSQ